jgi:hypothetical protein
MKVVADMPGDAGGAGTRKTVSGRETSEEGSVAGGLEDEEPGR